MVTSKSSEQSGDYTGGVSVFSGRRDPSWPLSADEARALLDLWDALEPAADDAAPQAPPLGYRGGLLRAGAREWLAYKGFVTLREGAPIETRLDPGRRFEKLIISTAPQGAVPQPFLDPDLRADG
ncbi:MAG: hypothetical protein ABW250_08925, partial [Pyrinomonadaceae bacterium]